MGLIREVINRVWKDSLHSNTMYLILNVLVMSALGFAFWYVVAKFHSDAVVGFGSATISAGALLSSLSLIGLNYSIIYYLPKSSNPLRLVNTYLTLPTLVSIGAVAIFFAGLDFWAPALLFIRETPSFPLLFTLMVALSVVFGESEAVFIGLRKSKYTFLKNLVYSIVKIPVIPILAVTLGVASIVSAWTIGVGVAVLISLFYFMPKLIPNYRFKPTLDQDCLRGTRSYVGGSYLSDLLVKVLVYVLPIVVLSRVGAENNAYFYIAWMGATILFSVPAATSYSLFAASSYSQERIRELTRKATRFCIMLLTPAAVLFYFVGPWFLSIFGASYQLNAVGLLRILIISSFPLCATHIYTSILRATGRIRSVILLWLIITTITVGGGYLLLPTFGIISIGYTWLLSHCIVTVYILISKRKYLLEEVKHVWKGLSIQAIRESI